MTDLTPVGLSKDGSSLILLSNRGVEFTVLVDQRLRAALRGDDIGPGPLEKPMESTLRPREIQARIRAGATVEEVAQAAGSTVEKVMVFARPVIAEREHYAGLAQQASLRRRSSERNLAARTLKDAAALRFQAIGVPADDVAWDAWRRDDGRWTVVASYSYAEHVARAVFTYDAPGRYVVAENEEAQLLTGELVDDQAPAASAMRHPAPEPPVLAAVESPMPNSSIVLGRAVPSDVPLGDDAIEIVRPAHEMPASATDSDAEPADVLFETRPIARAPQSSPPPAPPRPPASQAPPKKKGRASVPSWDEIMFGGKDD